MVSTASHSGLFQAVGRYVLCQYQIVPHLGRDPVADRFLANLLRWVTPDSVQ